MRLNNTIENEHTGSDWKGTLTFWLGKKKYRPIIGNAKDFQRFQVLVSGNYFEDEFNSPKKSYLSDAARYVHIDHLQVRGFEFSITPLR